MKNLFILLLSTLAYSAFSQDDLCSKPLDKTFPKLTVEAPDLSLLAKAGEEIMYDYTILVLNPNPNAFNVQRVSSNMNSMFYNTTVVIPAMNLVLEEGDEKYLDVTVRLSGTFKPAGATMTQEFNFTENYKVKTAGLCLKPELKFIDVSISLPPAETFKSYSRLMMTEKTGELSKGYSLQVAEVFKAENNSMIFRVLERADSQIKFELSGRTLDNKRMKATIPLEVSSENKFEIELRAADFEVQL